MDLSCGARKRLMRFLFNFVDQSHAGGVYLGGHLLARGGGGGSLGLVAVGGGDGGLHVVKDVVGLRLKVGKLRVDFGLLFGVQIARLIEIRQRDRRDCRAGRGAV